MAAFSSQTMRQALMSAILALTAFTVQAQSTVNYSAPFSDSTRRVLAAYTVPADVRVDNNIAATSSEVAFKAASHQEQQRLLSYLKALDIPDNKDNYKTNKTFYYHLAGAFAKLRLYPLAMKCFIRSIKTDDTKTDSLDNLTVNLKDDENVSRQAKKMAKKAEAKSKAINYQRILDNFNDGKSATAYAMLFHVKQPVPGKKKIYVGANTGHTFITLIKYNTDSTYSSASFGFYPKKDHFLSATPVMPTTSATFKDDTDHQWDQIVGKFISKRKFDKILKLTKEYDNAVYNLNNQNCTDFGLQAANLAGLSITDTKGSWPLGSGNNPALTGQSILEGKIQDQQDIGKVFTSDTVKQVPM
ncbi:hypothetical protein [Mucilaginibacter myungsuensis]|uniref:DUF4105 domain-containing protein n=1 Tax=Mucilaginibacter myungsuensis TaxID=649104 RepID=A0A929PWH5_9SPHI|nr:hypothetical protein [Mucilaginibacter myungsuensis]MBE9662091.1 hypothetical protein [Mucilaginibacter myungsuensis]MDN3599475.1 hypothetical protein [Mucilaginibacter myungsuensis]